MSERELFIGRQPILDRQQRIVGFELLFRAADHQQANITDYLQACASVISDALAGFGINELLGRHKGYINMVADLLLGDAVEILPRERVVIELHESMQTMAPAVLERCRELKAKGYILALDDHSYDPSCELLDEVVSEVKIDVLGKGGKELAAAIEPFSRWKLTLVAEKVESEEQFHLCRDLGFDLFQGFFFARPEVISQKRLDVAEATILRLIKHILADDEISVIEETFRRNPNLTYNLLRLVNSVSTGLREKIRSLRHAITLLGRQQLLRWLQLAVYASSDSRGAQNPLLEVVAGRGRFMELMANRLPHKGPIDRADRAFMTGVLSLIDVLFKVPMGEIITHLNLSEEICQALLDRQGELGKLLATAESLELYEFDKVERLLRELGLSFNDVLLAEVDAINWASRLCEAA